METVIISLLMISVCVLLYIVIKGDRKETENGNNKIIPDKELPSIIGQLKISQRQSQSINDNESQSDGQKKGMVNFDYDNQGEPSDISLEKPSMAAAPRFDWEEEEGDMERSAAFTNKIGLATGVTFDELANLGKILQRQELEISEKQNVAGIMSKIDGTELLSLLESNIGDVARKITELLDESIVD